MQLIYKWKILHFQRVAMSERGKKYMIYLSKTSLTSIMNSVKYITDLRTMYCC